MSDLLGGAAGERMELDAYFADFEDHFWSIGEAGFWKLERRQTFKEPGYDSWEAFREGDWDEALRLIESGRAELESYHRKVEECGFTALRARVVEEPISDYLQWELHALRVRDECGGGIRVVGPESVAAFEAAGPVPEICTLGLDVMYQAVYDDDGVLESARKYVDRDLIRRCRRITQDLYEAGEPLKDYFARRVAPLPPPGPQ